MQDIERIRTLAQEICSADGRGIEVADVLVQADGSHILLLSIPPEVDVSRTSLAGIAGELSAISGVHSVTIDVPPTTH